MKKITVLDFCNQIGAASDEIPVVVKAGPLTIGHFASLYRSSLRAGQMHRRFSHNADMRYMLGNCCRRVPCSA